MNQYQVVGKYHTYDDDGTTKTHRVCRTVDAKSVYDAIVLCDQDLPFLAQWISNPVVTETLASLERAALADWNAARPTSQPLALAQARGEL